jgi:hypothetical protein
MSLPSNEMQNSCEAESSACSTPARHFSQRLPGSQNEPANDWDTIPKRKTYSLSEKVSASYLILGLSYDEIPQLYKAFGMARVNRTLERFGAIRSPFAIYIALNFPLPNVH